MPSTTILRGNVNAYFLANPSLTPSAVTGTSASQTFTVPGLLTTDYIQSGGYIANQTAGIFIAECDCLTNNVLTIQFGNVTASPATPGAGVYEFQIVRYEGPAPTTAS